MMNFSHNYSARPLKGDPVLTNRLSGWFFGAVVAIGLFVGSADWATAQNFKSEKVDAKYNPFFPIGKSRELKKKRDAIVKNRKKIDTQLRAAVAGGTLSSAHEKWVRDVRLNEMASSDAVVLQDLRRNRQNVMSFVNASRGAARAKLINVIIDKSSKIAVENYHPSARINAIRMMASLTEVNGNPQNKRPPRYSGKALRKVLEISNDAKSPAFVKAACLNGFADVAFLDGQVRKRDRIPADIRDGIVAFAMKMLADQGANLKAGTVSGYLARRSVQILGDLDLVTSGYGDIASVKAALQKVADDSSASVWTRFEAQKGLAKMGLERDKVQDFARSVGKLVVLVSKQEAGYVEATLAKLKLQEEVKSSVPAAKADGGVGPGSAAGGRSGGSGGGGKGSPAGDPGGAFGGGSADDATAEVYQDVMLPFHLRRVRTNVKAAVSTARNILGSSSKAKSGLSVDYKADAQLKVLISEIEESLDLLVDATDLGLDVRKRRGSDDEDLSEKEKAMKNEHIFKRVPFQITKAVKGLEDVVGVVKLPAMK